MIRAGCIIGIYSSVTPHVGADMKGWIKFTGFTMLVTVLLVSCAPRPLPQSTEAEWTPTNSNWKVRKSSSAATGHAKCTGLASDYWRAVCSLSARHLELDRALVREGAAAVAAAVNGKKG